jgi:hypothetical protein
MASEQILEVVMRRHLFDSEWPFSHVLDGIFGGISRPDIGLLFSKLAGSTSHPHPADAGWRNPCRL